MGKTIDLEGYLAGVEPSVRPALDRLRLAVREAHPGLEETIKWNAPNYADRGQDRITLGLDGKGGLRLVLHRGAAVRDASGFAFHDEEALARWPAADRGMVVFKDESDVMAKAESLKRLVARWIAATA